MKHVKLYEQYHNNEKVLTIEGDDSVNLIVKKLKELDGMHESFVAEERC